MPTPSPCSISLPPIRQWRMLTRAVRRDSCVYRSASGIRPRPGQDSFGTLRTAARPLKSTSSPSAASCMGFGMPSAPTTASTCGRRPTTCPWRLSARDCRRRRTSFARDHRPHDCGRDNGGHAEGSPSWVPPAGAIAQPLVLPLCGSSFPRGRP